MPWKNFREKPRSSGYPTFRNMSLNLSNAAAFYIIQIVGILHKYPIICFVPSKIMAKYLDFSFEKT